MKFFTVLLSSICVAYIAAHVNNADRFLLHRHMALSFDNSQLTKTVASRGDLCFCPPARSWGAGAWVSDITFQSFYINNMIKTDNFHSDQSSKVKLADFHSGI